MAGYSFASVALPADKPSFANFPGYRREKKRLPSVVFSSTGAFQRASAREFSGLFG